MKRFRGGLVFKAHRLGYHSTLSLRVIKKKKYPRGISNKRGGPIDPEFRGSPHAHGTAWYPQGGRDQGTILLYKYFDHEDVCRTVHQNESSYNFRFDGPSIYFEWSNPNFPQTRRARRLGRLRLPTCSRHRLIRGGLVFKAHRLSLNSRFESNKEERRHRLVERESSLLTTYWSESTLSS